MFPRRGEYKSVIQYSPPVGASIALKTRKNPGENSGNQPGLSIRCDGAMRRPAVNDRHDLSCGLNRIRMTGIQKTTCCDQFGFGNRGMPRVRFRKAALQDVHVNGRIVKQTTRQIECAFHERKGRYAPAGQWPASLLGLQATKNAASTDVRTQARVLS
jgi:hypothetical protein